MASCGGEARQGEGKSGAVGLGPGHAKPAGGREMEPADDGMDG